MLKNTEFKSGSYALGVPVGTSSIGPDSPVDGQLRYNDTNNQLQFYDNSVWNSLARQGNVAVVRDSFTGNANITVYGPMSLSYGISSNQEQQVLVFLNTVYQDPINQYTFVANVGNPALTDIQFAAVPDGANIRVIHNLASTTV